MTNLLLTSLCKTQILYIMDSVCPTSRCWFAGQTGLSDLIFTFSVFYLSRSHWFSCFFLSHTHRHTHTHKHTHREKHTTAQRQYNSFNVNSALILQPELITAMPKYISIDFYRAILKNVSPHPDGRSQKRVATIDVQNILLFLHPEIGHFHSINS